MGIKEIVEKIKEIRQNSLERDEDLPDDVTRDKYLRSLRRQDRLLDEEEEKVYLKKRIAERNRERMKKHLFGIKDEIQKKKLILEGKKKVKILSNGYSLLKDKKIKQSKSLFKKYNL